MAIIVVMGNTSYMIALFIDKKRAENVMKTINLFMKFEYVIEINWTNALMCLHVFVFIPWLVEQIKLYSYAETELRDCHTFLILSSVLFTFVLTIVCVEIISFFVYFVRIESKQSRNE